MQAVKAYYDEGTFVPLQPIEIPAGSHAIVTILDFPANQLYSNRETDEVSAEQIEAMRRFREEIQSNNEPVPEFERVKFREVMM